MNAASGHAYLILGDVKRTNINITSFIYVFHIADNNAKFIMTWRN